MDDNLGVATDVDMFWLSTCTLENTPDVESHKALTPSPAGDVEQK